MVAICYLSPRTNGPRWNKVGNVSTLCCRFQFEWVGARVGGDSDLSDADDSDLSDADDSDLSDADDSDLLDLGGRTFWT